MSGEEPLTLTLSPEYRGEGTRRDALPAMVLVPPGSFLMGADDADDKFASALEKPRHLVTIPKPFALAAAPTTFDEWDFYSAETGARRPRDFGHGRGALPVIDVSWDDAVGYVEWLSARTGNSYRLPSEAEWEYACRAGTTSVFSTGPTLSIERANYLYTDVRQRPGLGRPVPVASYPPNGFGLCDMHGNVCELVADSWHDTYAGAPADGSAWSDVASVLRVVRNGGWDAMPRLLRCAYRDWVDRTARLDNVGFRVACEVGGIEYDRRDAEGAETAAEKKDGRRSNVARASRPC